MIDAYRFGSITVDNQTYRSDLIIYPERINASWWRREGHNIEVADIQEVLDYAPECLVIGQGKPGLMKVPQSTLHTIEERGIEVYVAPTEQAVQRFNELSSRRKTVAALHLTC